MKKTINLIIFLFTTLSILGQTNKIIDSLQLELVKNQPDSVTMQVFSDLSYYYLFQSTDTSLIYAKELAVFATNKGSSKFLAKAYKNIGNALMYSNRFDSAYIYFNNALRLLDSASLNKSAIYSSLGILYKRQGNFKKSLEIYFEGLKYDEQKGDDYGRFVKLMNIGNLYTTLEDYNKSIKYEKIALELSKTSDDANINFSMGTLLNNIGINYYQIKDFVKAIEYFNKSLTINIEKGNKKEIARNYNNIGVSYEHFGETDKALNYLNKALIIREELGDKYELIETNMALGTAYGKASDNKKALFHFNVALSKAKNEEYLPLITETYLAISNHYSFIKQPTKALLNYKLHIQYKDSIFKLNVIENINEIEIKYETEKKGKEFIQQKLVLEQNENALQKKNTQYNYMTGLAILLLLVSILGWLIFQQRQKRKKQEIITLKREYQIKTLETLMEGEEKERFRIAKELHDGVNGDLSAIKFKLSSMFEMNNNVISEAITMIDNSCKQVRAISHNLVPPSLENFDLIEATEEYCHNMDEIYDPKINFQFLGKMISLKKKTEINIFRIIQELVTNSVKHAEATEINVQISSRKDTLLISVEDNGKGFDKKTIKKGAGIGLNNIDSRIKYLQATIDFVSNTEGTSHTIEIDRNILYEN